LFSFALSQAWKNPPPLFQGLEKFPRFFPSLGKTVRETFQSLEKPSFCFSNPWVSATKPEGRRYSRNSPPSIFDIPCSIFCGSSASGAIFRPASVRTTRT
jgi:hypothetical protein